MKGFLQRILQDFMKKKIILGTSDSWSTSCLSHCRLTDFYTGGQLLWVWYLSLHCQSKFQSYLMESFLPWNFPIAKGSSGDLSTFPSSSSTSTKYCTDDSRGNCPGSQDLPLGQAQFFFQKAIVSLCTICAAPLTSSQVAWTISEIFVSHAYW